MIGPLWKMSETPASITTAGPVPGEHNEYVFGELLGMSREEVAKLELDGIIA
jgi:crotonobetainyl-CoA:carnitine CoA-transferase CaiB-like acyl-CoA transferase